jgi:hypothetical protein
MMLVTKNVDYKKLWLGCAIGYDALPSHGGETQARVSQSQVAKLGLGSTLPASNSRKG